MGKRKSELSIETLHKELKKLKRKIKQSRRRRRHSDDYDEHGCQSYSRSRSHSRSRSYSRRRSLSRRRSHSRPRSHPSPISSSRSRSRSHSMGEHIDEHFLTHESEPPKEQTVQGVPEVPEEIIRILGDEGIVLHKKAEDLHSSLNTRWIAILQDGLNAETRDMIKKKYDTPNNCQLLIPPKLNEEVAAAMNDSGTKRDKRISDKQATLAAAISAIGQVLNIMLTQQNIREIETLSDASRLLCDIFHSDTVTRRSLILPGLNKDLRELMENTTITEYLFGDKLQDRVTACKAVKKSAQELKNTVPSKPKLPAKRKFNNNLNYRGPQRPPMPRPSGPKPKMRRPAYQQTTPSNRARRSPPRQQYRRQTRR